MPERIPDHLLSLHFRKGDEELHVQHSAAVPRFGDHVVLGKPDMLMVSYTVVRVVWIFEDKVSSGEIRPKVIIQVD